MSSEHQVTLDNHHQNQTNLWSMPNELWRNYYLLLLISAARMAR